MSSQKNTCRNPQMYQQQQSLPLRSCQPMKMTESAADTKDCYDHACWDFSNGLKVRTAAIAEWIYISNIVNIFTAMLAILWSYH